MKNLFFGYSTSTVTNPSAKNEKINLDQLVELIKTSSLEATYKEIAAITYKGIVNNSTTFKKEIAPLKLKLPYVLVSGYQPVGHNNTDIEYNGCVQLDIDFKEKNGQEKARKAKAAISKNRSVIIAAISPSGTGVKAIVKTNNTEKIIHNRIAESVRDSFSHLYDIPKKNFDIIAVGSAMFLPFDKNVYYNPDAEERVYSKEYLDCIYHGETVGYEDEDEDYSTGDFILDGSNAQQQLLSIYNYVVSECGPIGAGNRTMPTVKYASLANQYGIDKNIAIDFMFQVDRSDSIEYTIEDIYRRYSSQFGTKESVYNKIAKVELKSDALKVEDGKYLSSISDNILNLLEEKKAIQLVAATGLGKSSLVCGDFKMNRIIVVPTTTSLEFLVNKYNASAYYENSKTAKNGDNLIITTYSSFSNLMKTGINASDYTLIIDESHNFAVSASKSFRNKELSFLLESTVNFNKVLLLTGTYIPSLHPVLTKISVHYVESTKRKQTATIVDTTDYNTRFECLTANLIKDKLNLIFLNNTKEEGELGKLLGYLKLAGYNEDEIMLLNSKTKYDESQLKVIQDSVVPANIKILIVTSLVIEATDIKTHIGCIHILSSLDVTQLQQLVNRDRTGAPDLVKIYINMSKIDKTKEKDTYNLINVQDQLANLSKDLIKVINSHINLFDDPTKAMVNTELININKEYNAETQSYSTTFSVDYLAVAESSIDKRTSFGWYNPAYLKKYLTHFYNWEFVDHIQEVTQAITKEDMKVINSNIKESKDKVKAYISVLINKIELGGETKNTNYFLDNKVKLKDNIEVSIRYKIYRMCKYVTFDEAIRLIKEIGDSTKMFNTEMKRLVIASNINSNIVKEVYSKFDISKSYTNKEILAIVKTIYNSNPILKTEVNKLDVKDVMNKIAIFFDTSRGKSPKDNSGKRDNNYSLSIPTYKLRNHESSKNPMIELSSIIEIFSNKF